MKFLEGCECKMEYDGIGFCIKHDLDCKYITAKKAEEEIRTNER